MSLLSPFIIHSDVPFILYLGKPQPAVPSRERSPVGLCSWLLALKVFANFPPGPSPSWENGANVIWLTPLPVPGSGAGGLSHGQSWCTCMLRQLGGRRQCFRFAVLAWRRIEA